MAESVETRFRAPWVKVRNFLALEAVLKDLGVDPCEALRNAGLPPDLFSDPDRIILFAEVDRLTEECLQAAGCDDLGFRVGARQDIAVIGLAGIVSLNAPTIGDALRAIVAGLKLTDTGAVATLDVRDGLASLGYTVIAPGVRTSDQFVDFALAVLTNTMRRLAGLKWTPERVFLTRPPPKDRASFARYFGAPIEFGAPVGRLTFDAATLDLPVSGQDKNYLEALAPLLDRALFEARDDFVATVKAVARARLSAGALTRAEVCRTIGVNAYALTSRLKRSGVTFEGVVDDIKLELAKGMMAKGRTLREIAAALGFMDQSAFTRAFKRWTGETPARWRALSSSPRSDRAK